MNTNDAIETAHAFLDAVIVPVHYEGWAHFMQSGDDGVQRAWYRLTAAATRSRGRNGNRVVGIPPCEARSRLDLAMHHVTIEP